MRWASLTLALTMACAPLVAADAKSKTAERLDDSASLFSEMMGTPDRSIPQDLLEKSHCVVLVPDLKKAALVGTGGELWETTLVMQPPTTKPYTKLNQAALRRRRASMIPRAAMLNPISANEAGSGTPTCTVPTGRVSPA